MMVTEHVQVKAPLLLKPEQENTCEGPWGTHVSERWNVLQEYPVQELENFKASLRNENAMDKKYKKTPNLNGSQCQKLCKSPSKPLSTFKYALYRKASEALGHLYITDFYAVIGLGSLRPTIPDFESESVRKKG